MFEKTPVDFGSNESVPILTGILKMYVTKVNINFGFTRKLLNY